MRCLSGYSPLCLLQAYTSAMFLRVFRIAREFRLLRISKKFQRMLRTLAYALPSIGNIGCVLGIIYYAPSLCVVVVT